MPAYIKTLKEGSNIVYPQTKVNAVYNEDGENLSAIIEDINDDIDNLESSVNSSIDDINDDIDDLETSVNTSISGINTTLGTLRTDLDDLREDFENSSSVAHCIIELLESDWVNDRQTVSVPDATIDNLIMVLPDDESFSGCIEYGVRGYSKTNGYMTFICDTTPEEDLIINLLIADTEPIDLTRDLEG